MTSEGVALVDLRRGSWGRGGEPADEATMDDLLGNVKGFFKSDCTVIDNYVSRLHYKAALFYVPRLFWKAVEGGLIRNLVLQLKNPVLPEETKISSRKLLVEYLSTNLHQHNLFMCGYLTTEVGHFVNVIAQMLLMDKFLGGEFSIYGSEVLQVTELEWSSRSDPMTEVFPRLTQCTFYTFGPMGDSRKHDATCALPINILNERIYVFLWLWFIVLACLSGAVLMYRLLILIPCVRYFVLRLRARRTNNVSVERVCSRCNLGDWLVLYLLCKNMHPVNFRDVIDDYLQSLDHKVHIDNE